MPQSLPKKIAKEAHGLIRLADKVISYRQDQMPADAIVTIRRQRDDLRALLRGASKAERETVLRAMKQLEEILTPYGETIFPVRFLNENVEMLLVAAIIAIGIRTFFFQPFKIPTNSMYPTYAGMNAMVYRIDEPGPNSLERIWHTLTLGAKHIEESAPVSGEVMIPVSIGSDELGPKAIIPFEAFMGRKWFGFVPAPKWRYWLWVRGEPVTVEVPADFQLDEVIRQTYFPEYETLYQAYEASRNRRKIVQGQRGQQAILTGKTVDEGQLVVNFDIDTGDMLFVDRFSYYFVSPRVGDPIVFRTNQIVGLNDAAGNPTEQYYIKRLVGLPGDILEIKKPVLYRNGEPITGAKAFEGNAEQTGNYAGYWPMWRLREGRTDTVPEGYVYAMGDNSPESYDSRGWGFNKSGNPNNKVPQKEIIGRAFFIFYPFTNRFGMAQ